MLTQIEAPKPRIQRIRSYVDRCSTCGGMTSHDNDTRACLVCECAILRAQAKRRSK